MGSINAKCLKRTVREAGPYNVSLLLYVGTDILGGPFYIALSAPKLFIIHYSLKTGRRGAVPYNMSILLCVGQDLGLAVKFPDRRWEQAPTLQLLILLCVGNGLCAEPFYFALSAPILLFILFYLKGTDCRGRTARAMTYQ